MSPEAPVPVELYIYYRVADPVAALPRVRALQGALAASHGVHGRLLQRRDDAHTLMEIYTGITNAPAFERALDAAVQEHGLDALLVAGTARHTERFTCA